MRPVITLTTDFGQDDPFVGIMKGVILNIVPDAQIVDITHNIEPQNITQAALILNATYPWFPRKTVHVVVVDPGVGGGST
ncbi:MAG: S-adenosyl-l-methionine hydroxide adenosyltransferase, partial [Nitrospina sp.]|nr:S-adenosyl-l-methionine hydroxide adenosyltransferase [Nitrospina sp.]